MKIQFTVIVSTGGTHLNDLNRKSTTSLSQWTTVGLNTEYLKKKKANYYKFVAVNQLHFLIIPSIITSQVAKSLTGNI